MNPESEQIAVLTKRLESLEISHRRLKRACATAPLLLSGLLALGETARAPKVIEAESFVLRDADGRMRGEWGPSVDHYGGIDSEGMHTRSVTGLKVFDSSGFARIDLESSWDWVDDVQRPMGFSYLFLSGHGGNSEWDKRMWGARLFGDANGGKLTLDNETADLTLSVYNAVSLFEGQGLSLRRKRLVDHGISPADGFLLDPRGLSFFDPTAKVIAQMP